jgi:hypothetical protein
MIRRRASQQYARCVVDDTPFVVEANQALTFVLTNGWREEMTRFRFRMFTTHGPTADWA